MKDHSIYDPADSKRILNTERWEELDPKDRRFFIERLYQNDNAGWPPPLGKLYGLLAQYLLREELKRQDDTAK